MEIDPRLRSAGDNGGVGGSALHQTYDPPPSSAHPGSGTGGYPELSSHVSPGDQLHSSTPSSSGHGYYGGVPHTPHSYYPSEPTAIAGAPRAEHIDPDDPLADLKRPRACEACRQLKVRCEPDNDHPTGSCRRCAKAGRTCVVTAPTRKRQKKTDSRVAELEKKIDALTASLHATRGRNSVSDAGDLGPHAEEHPTRRWLGGGQPPRHNSDGRSSNGAAVLGSPAHLAGNKRQHSGEFKNAGYSALSAPVNAQSGSPQADTQNTRDIGPSSGGWHGIFAPRLEAGHEFADVIDKGLVDVDTANKAFNRYVEDMAPHMPAVVFTPGTKMGDIRRTKPVLFLSILSVAIGPILPAIQLHLVNEVYRIFAERVVVKGEKSLELVQAILVSSIWYAPPDHYEELKFYQLIHMAVIMGMDIGMNRRTRTKYKPFGLWREIIGKKACTMDPDAPETRRAWVGCYFMTLQSTMALRRVLLVRWQPYMDECLEILENSPDALPSDKVLIHWAKLGHIGEEVGFQFSMDDPVMNLSLQDTKIQYALKGFEKQLDQWRKDVPSEFYSPTMRHFEHVLNVYMHEIAMHVDHNIDDFRPPFTSMVRQEAQTDHTTPAHVDALTSCLTSIHEALDIMSGLDYKTIRCLPTIFFARTSYVSVALIKLFSATSVPDSRLGQVFDPADVKVEYYLDKVIDHFKVAGDSDGGRTAAKFSLVLTMLKNWFLKRKDQDAPSKERITNIFKAYEKAYEKAGNPTDPEDEVKPSDKGDQDQKIKPGTTPLHLLSEVAMGDPNNRAEQSQDRSHYSQSAINGSGVAVGAGQVQDHGPGSAVNTLGSDSWSQYPAPPMMSSTTSSSQLYPQHTAAFQQASGYDDPTHPMMTTVGQHPQTAYAGFVPELGMQVGFDPDNLFALGNILDDGFFNFSMDGNPNLF